jgi:glycosyltransferase involved in cell wall biosynthesis
MPSAVLEAMAVGLPVIASSMNGIAADFVDSGQDGYIVAGEDPGLYAERIIDLLSNPEEMERVGKRARQRVQQEFSLGQVSSDYAKLYRRLMQV